MINQVLKLGVPAGWALHGKVRLQEPLPCQAASASAIHGLRSHSEQVSSLSICRLSESLCCKLLCLPSGIYLSIKEIFILYLMINAVELRIYYIVMHV